ncbi:Flotillin-like protein 1 [Camellia lanceoleosa]|uniref:Flotillin-like protein 1 n=1 Tax=Camellia lanceoleosa TaxID=1840588 RepID=A0ACC0FE89_9ERIC|nr:Flotillin-like protein 1 [Camellia lanceoleosa]
MYFIAGPSEVLAVTGCGIPDIKLAKKKWIWPGQKFTRVDISPVNYTFEVQAMSAEKLPFILPAVFTIGPRVDCEESMLKYAKLISPHDKLSNHVTELVQGVIEGETRVLAASMTMEQIFKGTKEFKKEVFDKVQLELDQFGLHIYNANVKQLVDVRGHEYFSYLGQKTQMEAANQARIDVAEAKMKGEIGSKQREGLTTQNAAKIDAETKIIATKRQGEGKKEEVKVKTEVQIFENQKAADVAEANAELATKKAGWAQLAQLAEVESAKAVALREAELQRAVEEKNALTQLEKLKAENLSKASVEYEIKDLKLIKRYKKQIQSCTRSRKKQKQFSSRSKKRRKSKARSDLFYTCQQVADGELYSKKKEAEGIAAVAEAQGFYLRNLLKEANGNYAAVRDYMMINSGANNGGGEGGAGGGGMKDVAGVYSMLPPLFQTVHEQTGMLPPAWLGTLPSSS